MSLHRLCGLLLAVALALAPAAALAQQDLDVEADPNAQSPLRQPERAWAQAVTQLPAGHQIRRLAFAHHILFVFHSLAGDERILATAFEPEDGRLLAGEAEPREALRCRARGVDPAAIAPALREVLRSPEWQRLGPRLDSLTLECHEAHLRWSLLAVPLGGFVEGQAIPTVELPFVERSRY
jgi:hypothetical protein